jgi:TolB protein
MNKSRLHYIWVAVCMAAVLIPVTVLAQYDYINITNPFNKKIPIAIPAFKAVSGSGTELLLAEKGSAMISDTLEFTSYFDMVSRGKFLFDPQKDGVATEEINFGNWTMIGAELLITGNLVLEGETIQMDLRLFDTFKGSMLLGKRYKGTQANYREMLQRFCSEVILLLTGKEAIFNSKIAFISNGSGNKEVFLCDFDGYGPVQFTENRDITLFPAWSSDGKWMAYTSYKNKKPELFIRNIRENRGAVVSENGINSTPEWVPGKLELAATLSFSGDPEIYLLTGDGKIIKRLTNSRGVDSSPSFSPDGSQMAFVSERSGNPQIYIMDVGSGDARRLTFQGKYNTQPSWSPTGDKIAFTSMDGSRTDICVIQPNGAGLTQLTRGSGNNESPSWSPDGSLIAFSSTREGTSRIYIMTAMGTDQRRLLSLPGQQTNPKWSLRINNSPIN